MSKTTILLTAGAVAGIVLIYFLSQQIPYLNLIDIDSTIFTEIIVLGIFWFLRPSIHQVAFSSIAILFIVMVEHMFYLEFLDRHTGVILFLSLIYLLCFNVFQDHSVKKIK